MAITKVMWRRQLSGVSSRTERSPRIVNFQVADGDDEERDRLRGPQLFAEVPQPGGGPG